MGILSYDPVDKPYHSGKETKDIVSERKEKLKDGKFDEVSLDMNEIVDLDLRMIDLSHFIICYLNKNIYTCGTIWELCIASQQRKPILVFCEQGKNNIPAWLFGVLNHNLFFDSLENLMEYLKKVDSGEICSKKWKIPLTSNVQSIISHMGITDKT